LAREVDYTDYSAGLRVVNGNRDAGGVVHELAEVFGADDRGGSALFQCGADGIGSGGLLVEAVSGLGPHIVHLAAQHSVRHPTGQKPGAGIGEEYCGVGVGEAIRQIGQHRPGQPA
jgi:hypothetical protein